MWGGSGTATAARRNVALHTSRTPPGNSPRALACEQFVVNFSKTDTRIQSRVSAEKEDISKLLLEVRADAAHTTYGLGEQTDQRDIAQEKNHINRKRGS